MSLAVDDAHQGVGAAYKRRALIAAKDDTRGGGEFLFDQQVALINVGSHLVGLACAGVYTAVGALGPFRNLYCM
jgi:hypothetical protein